MEKSVDLSEISTSSIGNGDWDLKSETGKALLRESFEQFQSTWNEYTSDLENEMLESWISEGDTLWTISDVKLEEDKNQRLV